MVAAIFEVCAGEKRKSEYLNITNELKPILQDIDGFLSIERFSSLAEEGKVLSLSFWRDEEAIQEWKKIEEHHMSKIKGCDGIMNHCRLRVANVYRDN
ncbi:MAG: antibiotic biosynthesis monooxygenase [Gammaproteobacteria bacterium]|nr:antibiotic biosynthesis monooxygenase [Gammaproteobacteria bacterium]